MKHSRLILLLCAINLGVGFATAQTGKESISKDLKEVVVESENQKITPQLSTYYPTVKQKNAAKNATTLLGMMSIPQIDVDLGSGAVKTLDGNIVAIYIDNIEASSKELEGMKTTDVKRVEFYAYPTNPRFKGARYVINFIMQQYLYGGYTKLTAEKQLEVNRTAGFVYSKLSYKKMIYDIYAGTTYMTTRHNGTKLEEEYRLSDMFNEDQKEISRISSTENSRLRDNSSDFVFRTLYNNTKVQLSNKVTLVLNRKPINETGSAVIYSPEIFPSGNTSQNNKLRNLTAAYNGDYFYRISERMSLQTDFRYTYGNNSSKSRYLSAEGLSIINDASETSSFFRINPRLSYKVSSSHNLTTYFTGAWNTHRIDYTGSTPSLQRYKIQAYFAGIHYDFVGRKIQTGVDIGWGLEANRISEVKSNNSFPTISAYANYMPVRKHMLALSMNYVNGVPEASQKSPNMLQQDELMWFTGSPDLKDYGYMSGSLNYTWLPNNKWQLSSTAAYSRYTNRCVAVYTPTAPEGAMLRHYVNGGEYSAGMFAINATGRFLRNSLVINLMPQIWAYHTSGIYRSCHHDLNGRAQISYFNSNFHFSGGYSLRRKYPSIQAEYQAQEPEQYQLQAGWGNGSWNITLSAFNLFRNSWESSRQTLSSQWYDYRRINYSISHHRRFEISIRYTIGYGKKLDQRNELSKGESSGSAILK